ncbi:MAG: S9 family peptidase [Acidobacteria bacterium]|nr:S9 family peptidase [Acidobacteriota bacterium]
MHKFKDAADPRCSPDGKWIAYTLASVDPAADKRDTDIWMVSYDGKENIRVTTSPESETSPRWSPDGRYLAFLSGRPGTGKNKGTQIWLLDRRGGEAQQITDTKARISGLEWAPDSKRVAVLVRDEEEEIQKLSDKDREKPRPIVIDRYSFKRDGAGYLSGMKRTRIQLLDVASKKMELLTTADFDEGGPVWSPDGTRIAFTSNHAADWDKIPTSDVFVVDAKPGATPKKLTVFPGSDTSPVWSPDGKWIAYLQGSEHGLGEYNMTKLAVIGADGGVAKILTASLDRGVSRPDFTADGKALRFLVADDMSVYLAQVPVAGGAVERLTAGQRVIGAWDQAAACTAALVSSDNSPGDLYVLDGGSLRKLTGHNDALLAELTLPVTEEVKFKSKDGNEAHGLLTKPLGYEAGKKYPLLLRIHGGPNAQDQHAFQLERQMFAASGYAVLNVNYRGSSGRGQQYTVSIAKDWGNKEVLDLLAGVDHVVASGVADPEKLGVGGWSYGGILTDYLVATTTRFKAATSGAGVAFPLAFYGHDQYIRQYDNEIGPPWKTGIEPWVKISYPFLHADRIKTPTLFLCGDKDFNVPLLGSEQMYQALRNVGVDTQLIIYPGENHGIAKPSFQRDRMQRYLDWYKKYLN